ncbi:MAG: hypothetical protein H6595_11050 [Flavobacteriales bacterium]|nr:hypothetical protein [Flavobacteriales bacterium]MCB9167999.1 hypothetical protein [Flavobacteriales bacterium]
MDVQRPRQRALHSDSFSGMTYVPDKAMRKLVHERIFGYALWVVGLCVFLPRVYLIDTGTTGRHFLMFMLMLVCLMGGYLLVDAANTAIKRRRHDHGA